MSAQQMLEVPEEHYVTVLDSAFAPQLLALHRSLIRHTGAFRLWVLCMDDALVQLLARIVLPSVEVIPLSAVLDDRIATALADRSAGERSWTMTPFTFDAVFAREATAERVTYLDADLWFLGSPRRMFERFESSGASVMLTEHAFAAQSDLSAESGRYCVQFLPMRRGESDPIRAWWQDRCIEWCYARLEDGRFGDQKYLDDWLDRFPDGSVLVAPDRGAFQGPWNAARYPYSEAVTYHFHGLRLLEGGQVRLFKRLYEVPRPHVVHVYGPYLDDLRAALATLRAADWSRVAQGRPGPKDRAVPRRHIQRAIARVVDWARHVPAANEVRDL